MAEDSTVQRVVKERLPVWDALPFFTFVVINSFLCWKYYDELASLFGQLNGFTFVLLGLATYRVAQIIANERVARVFRAPFVDVKIEHGHKEEVPKRRGVKETIGSLIYCPSCVGVWIAAAFVYALVFVPNAAWVGIVIFAASAVERVMSPCVDLLSRDR